MGKEAIMSSEARLCIPGIGYLINVQGKVLKLISVGNISMMVRTLKIVNKVTVI